MGKRDEILSLFPDGLKGRMKPVLEDVEHLNEIRLGVNRPCRIIREGCEYFLSQDGTCLTQGNNTWLTSDREIESIVNQMCSYSLYAFENELRQGFLTVQGGHRIGFAGKVILNTDGSVRNFSCIRFLNIRISHEILGMAGPVLPSLCQPAHCPGKDRSASTGTDRSIAGAFHRDASCWRAGQRQDHIAAGSDPSGVGWNRYAAGTAGFGCG